MRPNFGPDDNGRLIELAYGAVEREGGLLHVPTKAAEEAVEFHGNPGSDVAYVRLTWTRDYDRHSVYRATRDKADRVRLRLLDEHAYTVTRNGELRLRSTVAA